MPVAGRIEFLALLAYSSALLLSILCRPCAPNCCRLRRSDVGFPINYGDVIGIDLGRAYSRVGVFKNDSFEIIPDEQGRTAIPSYVAFLGCDPIPLVGFEAKEQASRNVENTVYDFRLLLGRNFSSPELQKAIGNLKYSVIDSGDRPLITIDAEGSRIGYSPVDIQAFMLRKLKSMADAYLNTSITHAVITIPSDFDYRQRHDIKKSAAAAGLSVLFGQEATCIGRAYGIDERPCDASGRDTDCNYILLDEKESGFELTLLVTYRGLIERLGTVRKETMDSLQVTATSDQLRMQEPDTQETELWDLLRQLLDNAFIHREAIDGIIITSEVPHITKTQITLQEYFPGRETLEPSGFSQDQAIVCGAAIQGHVFSDT